MHPSSEFHSKKIPSHEPADRTLPTKVKQNTPPQSTYHATNLVYPTLFLTHATIRVMGGWWHFMDEAHRVNSTLTQLTSPTYQLK